MDEADLIALVQETADRSRRIETRLTKFLVSIGCETGARRPVWLEGAIEVPSLATSLTDIVASIPAEWPEDEEIYVGFQGHTLGYVLKP